MIHYAARSLEGSSTIARHISGRAPTMEQHITFVLLKFILLFTDLLASLQVVRSDGQTRVMAKRCGLAQGCALTLASEMYLLIFTPIFPKPTRLHEKWQASHNTIMVTDTLKYTMDSQYKTGVGYSKFAVSFALDAR